MPNPFVKTYRGKSEFIHHFAPTVNTLSAALIYPITMGYFQSGPDYMIDREGFDSLLFIYTISGLGSLSYNGVDYTLKEGTIALFDCNSHHMYQTQGEYWEFKWVHFTGANSMDFYNLIYNSRGVVIGSNERIEDLTNEIFKACDGGKALYTELLFHRAITDMFCEIMLSGTEDAPLKHGKNMQDALSYIEENYRQNIKVDTLADIACMSKYHFIRKFKECFSDSPYGYVIRYRLEKAKELLINTDLKLDCIAGQTGFNSASHLIQVFKKYYSCSPYVYKTMLKNFNFNN